MSDDQTPDPIEGDSTPGDTLVEDAPATGDADGLSQDRANNTRSKIQQVKGNQKQNIPSAKKGSSSLNTGQFAGKGVKSTGNQGKFTPSSSSLDPANQNPGNIAKGLGKNLKNNSSTSHSQNPSGPSTKEKAMNAGKQTADTAQRIGKGIATEGESIAKEYAEDLAKGGRKLAQGKFIEAAKEGTKKIRQDAKVIGIAVFAALTLLLLSFLLIISIFVAIFGGNAAASATTLADKYLTITKTSNPAEVANGQQFTYTITIDAKAGAGDVSVSDALPTEVKYISSTGGSTVENGFVIWTSKANNLTAPFTASFNITVLPINNDRYVVNVVRGSVDPTAQATNPSCGQKLTPPSGPAPGFSCTGAWGTQQMQDKFYYATSFGCSTVFGPDPGDNCIPGCPISKIPECQSSGTSGRACEETLRWYAADSGRFGCGSLLKITNSLTGKAVVVRVIDAGPACWVENNVNRGIVDMSKDAANALFGAPGAGWADRKSIYVEPLQGSAPLGPVTCP